MKKKIMLIAGLVCGVLVVLGITFALDWRRQNNILREEINEYQMQQMKMGNLIAEGKARSENEMLLDDAKGRIESTKQAINKKKEELSELEKEIAIYYQSIPAIKAEIKREVEERNNIEGGL